MKRWKTSGSLQMSIVLRFDDARQGPLLLDESKKNGWRSTRIILSTSRKQAGPLHDCFSASSKPFSRSHHQATITNQCSSFFNGTFCDASTFRYASTFRDTSTFGDAYEDCLLEMVTRRSTRVILSTRQAVLLHRRKENECISSEAIATYGNVCQDRARPPLFSASSPSATVVNNGQ